jgi:putative membrane protein
MIKKMILAAAFVSLAAVGFAGCSSEDKKSGEFLQKSAHGAPMEVELGKLVAARATRDDVRRFAQTMVEDHTREMDELRQLAAKKNMTLDFTPDKEKREKIEEIKQKSGSSLDTDCVEWMVKDHTEDVDSVKKQAESGTDADVKAFAAKSLPMMQHHLEMARQIVWGHCHYATAIRGQ